MKATEQYFPVELFIMLYTVVLTFESVEEILQFHHLSESCCLIAVFQIREFQMISGCNLKGKQNFHLCSVDFATGENSSVAVTKPQGFF